MSGILKLKIFILIIIAILTSVISTVYFMKNVYKPKAADKCVASLSNINYRGICYAYYSADYKCSDGSSGTVGGEECQLYTTLYQKAKDSCYHLNKIITSTKTPTPTPKAIITWY